MNSWCEFHSKATCSTAGKGLYAVIFDDGLSSIATKANDLLLRAHKFNVIKHHPNDAWGLVKQWLRIGCAPYLITMDLNHSRGREYPPNPEFDTPIDGWGLGSMINHHLPDVNIVAVSNLVDEQVAAVCKHIGFRGLWSKKSIVLGSDDPIPRFMESLRSLHRKFIVTADIGPVKIGGRLNPRLTSGNP